MLGPFTTTSRLTPIHQMSLAVLSRTAFASMSTTSTTTTATTRDRGDRYGPMEWAQKNYGSILRLQQSHSNTSDHHLQLSNCTIKVPSIQNRGPTDCISTETLTLTIIMVTGCAMCVPTLDASGGKSYWLNFCFHFGLSVPFLPATVI